MSMKLTIVSVCSVSITLRCPCIRLVVPAIIEKCMVDATLYPVYTAVYLISVFDDSMLFGGLM